MFLPLQGKVKKLTDRAVLFSFKNYGELVEKWIPKSVIDEGDDVSVGDEEVLVAEWFCDKEDFAL